MTERAFSALQALRSTTESVSLSMDVRPLTAGVALLQMEERLANAAPKDTMLSAASARAASATALIARAPAFALLVKRAIR